MHHWLHWYIEFGGWPHEREALCAMLPIVTHLTASLPQARADRRSVHSPAGYLRERPPPTLALAPQSRAHLLAAPPSPCCCSLPTAPPRSAFLPQTSIIESALALNQQPDSDDTVNLLAAWYPNRTATVSRVIQPGAGGLGLAPGRHKITFRSDSIIRSRTEVFRVNTGGMNSITFNRAFA